MPDKNSNLRLAILLFGAFIVVMFACSSSTNENTPIPTPNTEEVLEIMEATCTVLNMVAEKTVLESVALQEVDGDYYLMVTVTDTWYDLRRYMQERLIREMGESYIEVAERNWLNLVEPGKDSAGTTIFVDRFYEVVAAHSVETIAIK